MDGSILHILKECSKDQHSLQKLKKLFEEFQEEIDRVKHSLTLLERAIRSDYDSILITDLELEMPGPRIVYVNDGFIRMTGYSREEVIGKTPRILQGEKTDPKVLEKLKNRLKAGQPFFGHTVNYRKDGSEFVNQWDIHPLTDENGNITHWVSYQHDITERKRSEKKILDTRVEFDDLHEEAKSTLLDVDEQGNIISANKMFRELVKYDTEELKQLKFWEMLSERQLESFRQRFDSFKPSDFDDRKFDLILKNQNGESIEVKAETRLLTNNGQQIIRIKISNLSMQRRIIQMLKKRNTGHDRIFGKKTEYTYKLKESGKGNYVFSFLSENFRIITGKKQDELKDKSYQKIIAEDDWPSVEEHFRKVFSGNSSTLVYRIRSLTGKLIPVIDSAKPIKDDKGDIQGIKGNVSIEISSEKAM